MSTPARTAPSMAALNGDPVTEAHANWCAEHGHASHRVAGVPSRVCPRCGEVTEPVCAECARPARYTFGAVSLCTAHRGLLGKYTR